MSSGSSSSETPSERLERETRLQARLATEKAFIYLKTEDGDTVQVDRVFAMKSNLIKGFLEEKSRLASNTETKVTILLGTKPLNSIITLFKQLEANQELDVKEFSDEDLKDLLKAADYLLLTDLLSSLAKIIAGRLHNRSPEYSRNFYGIKNDYTEEQEHNLREQLAWAFEDNN